MIKGKQVQAKVFVDKPSFNYRKLDALNQTMLKVFDSDPVKFYEEFKLGRKRRDKKNTSLIIGDLVDFYLLECKGDEEVFQHRFDEKFVLFDGAKGTGQVFVLADMLFDEAETCLNDKGEVGCSFESLFTTVFARIQADGKYKGKKEEQGLEDFYENGKVYFDKRMENIGKTVVEASLVDKARKVAENLLTDEFSRDLFRGHDEEEYHTHFGIEWKYEISPRRTIACKSEIDILITDHDHKIIQPVDLKTTYDNELFDINYIKNGYYLQNAFYVKSVEVWAKDNGLTDYQVRPMKFVVGDTSSNNRRPLVYETTKADIDAGMKGFNLRGVHYRGVEELARDIDWAEENDIWNCSKEAYDNRGQMKLKINYE